MTLEITLEPNRARLNLLTGPSSDSISFPYHRDLDTKLTPLEVADLKKNGFVMKGGTAVYKELLTGLITGLDKLLRKNKIDPVRDSHGKTAKHSKTKASNGVDIHSLKGYKIEGGVGRESTAYKITQAFVAGLKI